MSARQEDGRSGGKIESNLSEVNTRALSRVQKELIGEFKMAAGDVIRIRDSLWSTSTYFKRNKK